MPGVYLEYIKAGKFVVPVELTFQTETIKAQGDIRGLVSTSKWIERHNWKEIKAMLKPAVEACLKYNDTPLENIPKSHHISYGREVSLGYLVVPNKVSTPFLHVLDSKKNCWTDDEDDEDELLGIRDPQLKDHGPEFSEYIPTKTAIRVCVVRKSVVSIDDARRIRKELGVRSDDVRHYFSSAGVNLSNEPGPSSASLENSEQADHETRPPTEQDSVRSDRSSDSEVENVPRTFGDPDEIRDAARIYTLVLSRDADSGEDPDDDLSLPDIEPNPPKRKKGTRNRKKSTSLSPSKSKRLTHINTLAVSHEGQANFSEEDTGKRGGKKSKRKRTVAVVEPMRTLPNGQMSFEHAIGAMGTDKRRKARPGSSHGADKAHCGGGRSKQTPAIDIIAPDDDRLTITNPPEPIPVVTPSTSNSSPTKDAESEKKKLKKKKKRRRVNIDIDDDPHKWERLTPSPLLDEEDFERSSNGRYSVVTSSSESEESDLEMPTLTKMVDSDEEKKEQEGVVAQDAQIVESEKTPQQLSEECVGEKKTVEETPTLNSQQNEMCSPDITQVKFHARAKKEVKAASSSKRSLTPALNGKAKENKMTPNGSANSSKTYGTNSNYNNTESRTKTPTITSAASTDTQPKRLILQSESELTNQFVQAFQVVRNNSKKRKPRTPVMQQPISQIKVPVMSPSTPKVDETVGENLVHEQAENLKKNKKINRTKKDPPVVTNDKSKAKEKPPAVTNDKSKAKEKLPVVTNDKSKAKEKPPMGDAQTQTDDLEIIAYIERQTSSTPSIISASKIKLSRSCEASSEDELCDFASQRSRTPGALSDISQQLTISNTSTHHPALGSPKGDFDDDDGLFSFESPSIPQSLAERQTPILSRTNSDEHLESDEHEPDEPELKGLGNSENSTSHEDLFEIPATSTSPQPGCSHWSTPPSIRATTPPPPPLTSSALMPPPISRPPRTPRKYFDQKPDQPPRLSHSSSEPPSGSHDFEDLEYESDTMFVGAEAANVHATSDRIYDMLNRPDMITEGMKMIQKVSNNEISVEEAERNLQMGESGATRKPLLSKALVPVSKPQRKRDLSPDICDIVPDKRLRLAVAANRRSRRESFDRSSRNHVSPDAPEAPTNAIVLRHAPSEDEASDLESPTVGISDYFGNNKYGTAYEPHGTAYEPHGDEFDLSQRSYCMLNIVPQYELKSRLYKMHSKAVRETSNKQLIDHFKAIRPDLFRIFQGSITSVRHIIYVSGNNGKRELRNLNVMVPFTSEQGSTIVTLIYDHLVPDKSMRYDYMDYVNFVLRPEAFIRMYSRINSITFQMAETEMRFRACYDGDVSQEEDYTLPALE